MESARRENKENYRVVRKTVPIVSHHRETRCRCDTIRMHGKRHITSDPIRKKGNTMYTIALAQVLELFLHHV